jgi:hypothetical protein
MENPIPVEEIRSPSALGMYSVEGEVELVMVVLFTEREVPLASDGVKPKELLRYPDVMYIRK